jgi:hypothetical protein
MAVAAAIGSEECSILLGKDNLSDSSRAFQLPSRMCLQLDNLSSRKQLRKTRSNFGGSSG